MIYRNVNSYMVKLQNGRQEAGDHAVRVVGNTLRAMKIGFARPLLEKVAVGALSF